VRRGARRRRRGAGLALGLIAGVAPGLARAQAIDLSHGGPVTVTAAGGIDWNQSAQTVTARDQAQAVRGDVTVNADTLIAHYRKKAGAAPAGAAGQPVKATPASAEGPGAASELGSGNEIYRLEADGRVHIYTRTDQAWGDHAIYDIDQAVLVLTGKGLRLTTPQDLLTARDAMEYWSARHVAVARGDATVTTQDGRRVEADTLVGYTKPDPAPGSAGATPAKPAKAGADPLTSTGKIEKVEAFGHVRLRTATDIVTGDKGVYVPDTGIARIVGHVHITRGDNQLNGAAAIVNMKTGLATLSETPGARVQGLVVPTEPQPAKVPAAKGAGK
jgi:lipopolysaccharide export system protein LptA